MQTRLLPLALALVVVSVAGLAAPGVRPVSVVPPTFVQSDTGAGDSGAGTFSGDGKFVFFLSDAPNLVANDHNGPLLDLFRRELATGKTTLVSVRADGTESGRGQVTGFSASGDGRFAAFSGYASDMVPADANGVADIFVRDLQLGITRLVSATAAGGVGNGESANPVLSADGKFVLFESAASDLAAAADANSATDVFLRDLDAGTTALISSAIGGGAASGASSALFLSADAEVIVFRSESTNLVPTVTGKNTTDLFVRRRSTGVTTRIVLPGTPPNPSRLPVHTFNHALSADGRYLAFRTELQSAANQLAFEGVWWFDLEQGISVRASDPLFVASGGDDGTGPVMTADGRTLAFEAKTTTTAATRVSVWNADTGLHTLDDLVLTLPPGFAEPINSFSPVLSPDGTQLVFETDASVPAAGVADTGDFRFYVRQLITGATKTPYPGTTGGFDLSFPEFSPDGTRLLVQTGAVLPGFDDRNEAIDLFLLPSDLGNAELLSPSVAGSTQSTGSGMSTVDLGGVSNDGQFVAFTSYADDLVENDHNGRADVIVRDMLNGTNQLVSVALDGQSAATGASSPRISGNGRFVVFLSTATNLAADDTNSFADVFVRDLMQGTTVLASAVDNSKKSGNGAATTPVVSADGRYVAFGSKATDLTPGTVSGDNVFLRDLTMGRTYLLSDNALLPSRPSAGKSSIPQISAGGETVTFSVGVFFLYSYSVATGTLRNVFTNGFGYYGGASLSADGGRMAFFGRPASVNGLFLLDNVAATNSPIVSFKSSPATFPDPILSADGRRVAFTSNLQQIDAGVAKPVNDVLVFDIANGVLSRASARPDGGFANGASDQPVISADGRFVAFRSAANDLVPDDANQASDIFVRDLQTGSIALLSRRSPDGEPGDSDSSRPVMSVDGGTVAFRSSADDLAADDINFLHDVFVASATDIPPYDGDGDGLPDSLERQLFGGLDQSGADDFDGDGVSNYDEFLAGTDLKDAHSFLRLQFTGFSANGSTMLSWQTVAGVSYEVETVGQLGQTWNKPGLVVFGDGGPATISASSGAGVGFFRLVVLPR